MDHDPPATTSAQHLPGAGETGTGAFVRGTVDEEFSAFYRAEVRALVVFLLHHGATLAVAADMAQEAMIQAHRYWATIRAPRAYVRTVAARALARKTASVLEDPVDDVPEPTSLLPRPDAYADWEDQHVTLALLRSLPPRQRQVLAWTLDGYTPTEIAEQLSMTPEAVRASLKKARLAAVHYLAARKDDDR
ncbi:RNA polymerase sigma-70 factor, ECF subfamily [Actinacidiphila alni]|uniref:RNA polymerase sigma-70 factor, ECF subfamily n=1 Tax=Actinacidiphila alni TaxID=380248 RepID=A0A1I2JJ20_9ACTN|nr:sigma-70 family RNA polymerase sigma factor [Actinacidiphila alni]SFF53853.1 RNA polymerase sigma-70 factor, ECF subfamily [Actinacidiphila alni]